MPIQQFNKKQSCEIIQLHLCDYSHFVVSVVEEIVWFDVSVNDTKLVDVSQGRQQVIDVQTNLFEAQ